MHSKIGLDKLHCWCFIDQLRQKSTVNGSTPSDMGDLSRFWRSCLGLAPKSFKIILLTKLSPLSVPDEGYCRKTLCALYLRFYFPLQQILNTCIVVYCTSSNINFHLNIWTQALREGDSAGTSVRVRNGPVNLWWDP